MQKDRKIWKGRENFAKERTSRRKKKFWFISVMRHKLDKIEEFKKKKVILLPLQKRGMLSNSLGE